MYEFLVSVITINFTDLMYSVNESSTHIFVPYVNPMNDRSKAWVLDLNIRDSCWSREIKECEKSAGIPLNWLRYFKFLNSAYDASI